MAADSAQKRYSAYDLACPWRGTRVIPTGTVSKEERTVALGLYAGLTLSVLSLTFSATEAPDTAALSSSVSVSATLSATESPDVVALLLSPQRAVVVDVTEAQDVASFITDNSDDGYTKPAYGGMFTRVTKKEQQRARDWLDRMIEVALKRPQKNDPKSVEIYPLDDVPESIRFVTFKPDSGILRPPLRVKPTKSEPIKVQPSVLLESVDSIDEQAAEVARQELARLAKIKKRRKQDEEFLLLM